MKQKLLIFVGIFASLAASRFIPHPPNFTSLIALSFYVPVLLGLRFLPFLIISFAITDLVIGYHSGTHWTWGSILLIGILSQYFTKSLSWRLGGALLGAILFFLPGYGVTIKNVEEATKAARDRPVHLNELKEKKDC